MPPDAANAVYFDRNADGRAEKGGWVAPADGLLVLDRDGDGRISDGQELMALAGVDALAHLATTDSNRDGRLAKHDFVLWEKLRVWRDVNGDGRSSADELSPLSGFAIESLNLDAQPARGVTAGQDVVRLSSYVHRNEKGRARRHALAIVNLAYDDKNTIRIIDPQRQAQIPQLPDLPAVGAVPALHDAMQDDHDGSNSAFVITSALKKKTLAGLFAVTNNSDEAVLALLYRRAALDKAPRDLYGPHIDARKIILMARMRGAAPPPPARMPFWDAYAAEQDFYKLFSRMVSEFMVQTAAAQLFDGRAVRFDADQMNLTGVTR
ncbi:MAG: hypothetical protein KKA05_06865, partial [Alphaproteobacteria bacterium]|nr:hypothetical protein [Alphaproteobacteria bacterium]